MTEADDIAAELRAVAPEIQEAVWWDTYTILRKTLTKDQYGGETTAEVRLEEGQRCQLRTVNRVGTEGPNDVAFRAETGYEVSLPRDTVLKESDEIEIVTVQDGERTFSVVGVLRGGSASLFTVAQLEF